MNQIPWKFITGWVYTLARSSIVVRVSDYHEFKDDWKLHMSLGYCVPADVHLDAKVLIL